MELLTQLKKTTTRKSKRVGRGYGSGVGGHTTGKGAKGDKIRGKTKLTFDGTKIKKGWIKRTPYLRGKHRVLSQDNTLIVSLEQISKWFKDGENVTPKLILQKIGASKNLTPSAIKVLAKGKLERSLNFEGIQFSESAKKMIITAGGNIK
jgi:large subunit ribosomal protein L15